MTLIECFDRVPVENIAGCLQLRPDKLIFLGDRSRMEGPARRYRDFFTRQGMNTEVQLCHIQPGDPVRTLQALTRLVTAQESCVIDVTGGEEGVLLAVGAMMAGLTPEQRQRVKLQKFDLTDCGSAGLTVKELIALHGGTVYQSPAQPPEGCTPEDIEGLWQLMCRDPKAWNKTIAVLNELESRAKGGSEICLPPDALASGIRDAERKATQVRQLLSQLEQCGVVDDRSSRDTLRYRYHDSLLRDCVKKAGNLLEVKTLLEARALRHDGKSFFRDCQMSVTIDWDGVVHDRTRRMPETRNEIDVLLVRGLVPLFISCKNGSIGEEELYKLNTVATRFGSPHARKLLIATDLDQKSPSANRAFIQRAKDMRIRLVTNAAQLTRTQWAQALTEAMEA